MDTPWIAYLNHPQLVVNVQKYFGVRYDKTPDHKDGPEHPAKVTGGSLKGVSITNKFWYYLFLIGTELGDEVFYASFIPFWFFNIDGYVGRRFVFVWASLMYVGQALKDILRCPRPPKPVVKLQVKWGAEYGLPSTHAIVGISIPFSILIYTMERYEYNFTAGIVICLLWCTLVCISRLYLGMHSVLDIVAGLVIAVGLMFPMVPLVDKLDYWLLTTTYSPILLILSSILLVKFYPQPDKWTPTRGDTTLCVGLYTGIQLGASINYHLGYMHVPDIDPPYPVIWPSYPMMIHLLIRTVMGLTVILVTLEFGRKALYSIACSFMGKEMAAVKKSEDSLKNKEKIFADLFSKYGISLIIGLNIQFLLPIVFKWMGIGRPDFYTEI